MMDIQERILELAMYITRFAVNQWDNEIPSSTPDSVFFFTSATEYIEHKAEPPPILRG